MTHKHSLQAEQTKRCFDEKLTVLDVIFNTTTVHPPWEDAEAAKQTFGAKTSIGTRWKSLPTPPQTSGYTPV